MKLYKNDVTVEVDKDNIALDVKVLRTRSGGQTAWVHRHILFPRRLLATVADALYCHCDQVAEIVKVGTDETCPACGLLRRTK